MVATDPFSFGRSDEAVHEADHSFTFRRNSLIASVEHLDLRRITLIVQDWGGLFALSLTMRARTIRSAAGDEHRLRHRPRDRGLSRRAYFLEQQTPDVGRLFRRGEPSLSADECAAYKDSVMGICAMRSLRTAIRGWPEPLHFDDGGHFVQERAVRIARSALAPWNGSRDDVPKRTSLASPRGAQAVRANKSPYLVLGDRALA